MNRIVKKEECDFCKKIEKISIKMINFVRGVRKIYNLCENCVGEQYEKVKKDFFGSN